MAAQQHATTASDAAARSRFFAASRPWVLQSFVNPDERRKVDRIMRVTSTTDEFTALRYLREHGGAEAAAAALRESIVWRKEVMEPLLRSPARVVDQLMTERIWLLPQPNRHGNPVVVFNSAKAALTPSAEEQAEMVLATLFVIEKAVSCSDNPLVEIDMVMNRSRSDDSALASGAQGLARIANMRSRFGLLAKQLRLHYPGRIRTASVYPPGPIVTFAVNALSSMFHIFPFEVKVR